MVLENDADEGDGRGIEFTPKVFKMKYTKMFPSVLVLTRFVTSPTKSFLWMTLTWIIYSRNSHLQILVSRKLQVLCPSHFLKQTSKISVHGGLFWGNRTVASLYSRRKIFWPSSTEGIVDRSPEELRNYLMNPKTTSSTPLGRRRGKSWRIGLKIICLSALSSARI